MSLNESFDSKKAVEFLKKNYEANRLSPAYLFVGEAEEQKRQTAIKLAQILNCRKSSTSECNCRKCKAIKSLEHPDIIWLSPRGKGSSIKIDEIRDLRRKLSLKPYELNKRVFIIYEADKMTEEAQNAFLKTLEEPPLDSVLILISLNTQGLLDTITSRCNIIKFKKKKDLTEQFKRYEIIDRFLSYKEKEIENLFDVKSRRDFSSILEALISLYRDVLILKSSDDKSLLINTDKGDEIKSLIDSYSYNELYQTVNFLSTMYKNINLNLNLKSCAVNTIFGPKKLAKT